MSLIKLQKIAHYRVTREVISEDEFLSFIGDWWSQKYNLPDNHPLFLEKTIEEHFIDYYADLFRKFPKELEKFEREIGTNQSHQEELEDEEWLDKMAPLPALPNNKQEKSSKIEENKKKTFKPDDFEDTY